MLFIAHVKLNISSSFFFYHFTKKQGVDYISFLIDCQCCASLNSLCLRRIGTFTAYHEVNNILR